MDKTQFIEKKLKEFDTKSKVAINVQEFIESALSECWDMAGESLSEKLADMHSKNSGHIKATLSDGRKIDGWYFPKEFFENSLTSQKEGKKG